MSYGYYNEYSNYLFISNPEDLKKELKLEDIGKEIFCLTKHAFCETCDKTLKAFGSEEKAQALVDKHLGYKKYAGHKAFVKTVEFPSLSKCTTADIIGTKANIDRNNALRETFYSAVISKIEQEIQNHADTIQKVKETFGFTKVENEIPPAPKELSDAYIFFSNSDAQGKVKIDHLQNVKELFDNTWRQDDPDRNRENPFERSDMMFYYINIKGHYRFDDHVYHWNYPIDYKHFVGIDQQVGDCSFCNNAIESWNDVYQEIHKHSFVHRDCFKHANEAHNLEWYAERYAKDQEKLAQEVTTS